MGRSDVPWVLLDGQPSGALRRADALDGTAAGDEHLPAASRPPRRTAGGVRARGVRRGRRRTAGDRLPVRPRDTQRPRAARNRVDALLVTRLHLALRRVSRERTDLHRRRHRSLDPRPGGRDDDRHRRARAERRRIRPDGNGSVWAGTALPPARHDRRALPRDAAALDAGVSGAAPRTAAAARPARSLRCRSRARRRVPDLPLRRADVLARAQPVHDRARPRRCRTDRLEHPRLCDDRVAPRPQAPRHRAARHRERLRDPGMAGDDVRLLRRRAAVQPRGVHGVSLSVEPRVRGREARPLRDRCDAPPRHQLPAAERHHRGH